MDPALISNLPLVHRDRDEPVLTEGEHCDGLFFLESGSVAIRKNDILKALMHRHPREIPPEARPRRLPPADSRTKVIPGPGALNRRSKAEAPARRRGDG